MVASNGTITEVIRILRKHLDDKKLGLILAELKGVKGNASFRNTIQSMYDTLRRKRNA